MLSLSSFLYVPCPVLSHFILSCLVSCCLVLSYVVLSGCYSVLSCVVVCSLVLSLYLRFCMCLCVCLLCKGIYYPIIYIEYTLEIYYRSYKYNKNILWSWTCVVSGESLCGLCGGLYRHDLQGDMLATGESSSCRSCRCGCSHHIWRQTRCKITCIQQDKGVEQKT